MSTLQIKRITGNWDTNKTYKPAPGEIVEIALEDTTEGVEVSDGFLSTTRLYQWCLGTDSRPITVIGTTGDTTVLDLVTEGIFYIPAGCCVGISDYSIHKSVPTDGDLPRDITYTTTDIKGNDNKDTIKFALADHTHNLEKTMIYKIMKIPHSTNQGADGADLSALACRRISMSYNKPSKNSEYAQVGDIHIKLSSNPME